MPGGFDFRFRSAAPIAEKCIAILPKTLDTETEFAKSFSALHAAKRLLVANAENINDASNAGPETAIAQVCHVFRH